jgi:hypothetical protein
MFAPVPPLTPVDPVYPITREAAVASIVAAGGGFPTANRVLSDMDKFILFLLVPP